MKNLLLILTFLIIVSVAANAQTGFNPEDYRDFLKQNTNLSSVEFLSRFSPETSYYNSIGNQSILKNTSYIDSVKQKLLLTPDELSLLERNSFFVSERMKYSSFFNALINIYNSDLPVFVTTDAILETIHLSYDKMLVDLENNLLKENLKIFLQSLYNNYNNVFLKYESDENMHAPLADVDIFVTVAYSLLNGVKYTPNYAEQSEFDKVWDAVKSEKMVSMPLFSDENHPRNLDFSQFTVRGHYDTPELAPYFRAMMWLGRTDFFLTKPPDTTVNWEREDLKRMTVGALILNELINSSESKIKLSQNEEIIKFMVGESDNLTPEELSGILNNQGIKRADEILDNAKFDSLQKALIEDENAGQKILSDFFTVDPFNAVADTLPVSYRVMGQKFIIDSYILSNVVYDKTRALRMMPDPLDASFALGNDDALPLLKDELEKYGYAPQLNAMRYLVDAYDNDFWQNSLYNTWLNSLRKLNPPSDKTSLPLFMRTSAWGQEKLNTQLASWAQLRHDNLLYAKQSYTGGVGCSFPHSYVEPYPEFYHGLYIFADKGYSYFSNLNVGNGITDLIKIYYSNLKNTMLQLENISKKELSGQEFTAEESEFLKQMLVVNHGECGPPPYIGWYMKLLYDESLYYDTIFDKMDFIVADVHTQPTDEFGNPVGKILHVGVGEVNLGVFVVESPSSGFEKMAYVGPVMSYYQKVTENFKRMTDSEWADIIQKGPVPDRPDWVNIYLADTKGNISSAGRVLPGILYTDVTENSESTPEAFSLLQNSPNPFNMRTTIIYNVKNDCRVNLTVYDLLGRKIKTLVDENQSQGYNIVSWDGKDISGKTAASGVYFYRLKAGNFMQSRAMTLLK